MTFEEFKKMAQTKPEIKCQSIFKVEIFFISMWNMDDNGEEVAPYIVSDIIDLDEPEISFFQTYEQARNLILSKKAEYPKSFYSGRVLELPLGIKIEDSQYLSISVFNRAGDISYHSEIPTIEDMCEEGMEAESICFRGYPEKEMPFNKGELVEVLDRDNSAVRLGIISKNPMSLEATWEQYQETGRMLDNINWYVIMIGEDDFEYFDTNLISKPSFPVSDDIKDKLHKLYDANLSEHISGLTDFEELLNLL